MISTADGLIRRPEAHTEDVMGRRRRPVTLCDDARRALIAWAHASLDEREMTNTQLAREIWCDPSRISRALSGRHMPPWELIEQIAATCGACGDVARDLWDAADAARQVHLIRRTEGYPPPNLADYGQFCAALRDLVDGRGISQRELVRRDETELLRRSTVGAVLRMQRSARRDVTIAMVRACGVPDAAVDDWVAVWDRLGRPNREAMDDRRRQIAYSMLGGSRRWGGAW
jgi:Helix-turn-helix domain